MNRIYQKGCVAVSLFEILSYNNRPSGVWYGITILYRSIFAAIVIVEENTWMIFIVYCYNAFDLKSYLKIMT